MGSITNLNDYRKRRNNPRQKARSRFHRRPRASLAGLEDGEPESLVQRLAALTGEMSCQLLEIMENALVHRLQQIQRFGGGFRRHLEFSSTASADAKGVTDSLRTLMGIGRLQLKRGPNLRIYEVRLHLGRSQKPSAKGYYVLNRTGVSIIIAFAAERADGKTAGTRAAERRSVDLFSWDQETLDKFIRSTLQQVFDEIEERD